MTSPGQGASGILRTIAGSGGAAAQFFMWGVLYGLTQQAMGPTFQEVANKVNAKNPTTPLTPDQAATAVLKGVLTPQNGADEALKSGLDNGRFDTLGKIAGQPPGLAELLSLYRRGELTTDLLHHAVRQSDIKDEWWENGTIEKLGKIPPSPVDFLEAHLEGQISEADAKKLYETYGGILKHGGYNIYDILFRTRGTAPSPSELIELLRRGVIPEDSGTPTKPGYKQGFLQGPWRNEWLEPFLALLRYVPPPRTVTTLVSHGSISDAYALQLFMENGLNHEDAAAYVLDAHSDIVAKDKELAVSQITTLYYDQAIDRKTAKELLSPLGYSSDNADFVLIIQDMRREQHFLEAAIARVRTLYVDHKIDKTVVIGTLGNYKIPSSQIEQLLTTWGLERQANIPVLSESQVTAAFYYQNMTQAEAMDALQRLGYSPYQSWVLLSNRAHGPLPNKPAQTAKNPYTSGG